MEKLKPPLLRVAVGLLLAASVSYGSSWLFAGTDIRTLLPLVFIAVLVVLARYYGTSVAVVGSLLCALVFAQFLFEPTGSLRVESLAARKNLLWMVSGAIVLSYLFSSAGTEHRF